MIIGSHNVLVQWATRRGKRGGRSTEMKAVKRKEKNRKRGQKEWKRERNKWKNGIGTRNREKGRVRNKEMR
jgi:hypothetical protein